MNELPSPPDLPTLLPDGDDPGLRDVVQALGGTTTHGLPYPLPGEPVAQGAAAIQALAEGVDGKLSPIYGRLLEWAWLQINAAGAVQAGAGSTGRGMGCTKIGVGRYRLDYTAFAGAPLVLVTPIFTTARCFASINVPSTTQVQINFDDAGGAAIDNAFMAFVAAAGTLAALLEELGPDGEPKPSPEPEPK